MPWAEQAFKAIADNSSSSLSHSGTFKPSAAEVTFCVIEGVFDPPDEVLRVVRQSAKFVTAEEEAESRKQELTALSKKCPIDSSSGTNPSEDAVTDLDIDGGDASEVHVTSELCDAGEHLVFVGLAPSLSCANSSFSSGSAEKALQLEEWLEKKNTNTPLEGSSRNVLSSVNPDLIARLNKMFSPMKISPHSSSQTSSRCTPSASRCEVADISGQCDTVDASDSSNVLDSEQLSTTLNSAEVPLSSQVKSLPHPPHVPCLPFKGTQSKLLQVGPQIICSGQVCDDDAAASPLRDIHPQLTLLLLFSFLL